MKKSRLIILLTLLGITLATNAKNMTDEEINKKNVIDFYNIAINEKDFDAATVFFGSYYTQHNPLAEDGIDGFRKFVNYLKNNFPESRSTIKKAIAKDNYVILHVHSVRIPNTKGRAIIDIFKLDNNHKIIEHWDVIQDIPEESDNDNGVF